MHGNIRLCSPNKMKVCCLKSFWLVIHLSQGHSSQKGTEQKILGQNTDL